MINDQEAQRLIESTGLDKAAAIYLITRLNKPIAKWDAYRFGLIDRNGKIVRSPENDTERRSLGTLDKIVLMIRRALPRSVLAVLSTYTAWKIISEEDVPENSLGPINDRMTGILIEVMMQANEEGITENDALRWLIDRAESVDEN